MTKSLTSTALAAAMMLFAGAGAAQAQTPRVMVVQGEGNPHAEHMMAMMNQDAPLLSFSVTEEIRSVPDRASISAGVTTQAPTAVDAMRQNAAQITQMIATLRRTGIAERDIQTSGVNLSPQYDYRPQEQGQPPRLIGYQVVNTLSVKTSDVTRVGALIDALVSAGGTNISGPNFFVENPDAALDTARDNAIRTATARAERYARAAGYSRARLVALSEGGAIFNPPPMMMARNQEAGVAGNFVQPGQVSNGITLNLQYRLER